MRLEVWLPFRFGFSEIAPRNVSLGNHMCFDFRFASFGSC